jgi:hypothetical protein
MGRPKGPAKALPEIPYSGALKRLFDPILDANFPVNAMEFTGSGKKYCIKIGMATRQWSLKVAKTGFGLGLLPVIDGHVPPESEVAFATMPSLVVQELRLSSSYIILWVFNSGGSSANLVFKEGDDTFSCDPLVNSVTELEDRIEGIIHVADLLLQIVGLSGPYSGMSLALKELMVKVSKVSTSLIQAIEKPSRPSSRREKVIKQAPSREGDGGRKAATVVRLRVVRAPQEEINLADAEHLEVIIETSRSLLDPNSCSAETNEVTLNIQTRVAGLQWRLSAEYEESPQVTDAIVGEGTPAGTEQAVQAIPPGRHRPSKKVSVMVPQTLVKKGELYGSKQATDELQQFEGRMNEMYPFGKSKHTKIDVDQMEIAPADYKYQPFHSRLQDVLVPRLATTLNVSKQKFTLMPKSKIKPTDFDTMIVGQFYIINGTHTYAAVQVIIGDPNVGAKRKEELWKWPCDFVWSCNVKELSHMSARCNSHNGYRWEEPEYLLHLQFVRDIWVNMERPVKVVIGKRSQLVNACVERWKVRHLPNS